MVVKLLAKVRIGRAENLDGEQSRIRRTRTAAGDRRDRNSARHLHRRIKRVESVQRAARDGNANHGQDRRCREDAAQMRRAASRRDDDLQAPFLSRLRILDRDLGRTVRRNDPRLVADSELIERLARLLHERPVGIRTHHNANLGVCHFKFPFSEV